MIVELLLLQMTLNGIKSYAEKESQKQKAAQDVTRFKLQLARAIRGYEMHKERKGVSATARSVDNLSPHQGKQKKFRRTRRRIIRKAL